MEAGIKAEQDREESGGMAMEIGIKAVVVF